LSTRCLRAGSLSGARRQVPHILGATVAKQDRGATGSTGAYGETQAKRSPTGHADDWWNLFATSEGKAHSASNVRRRILGRAVERANEQLARDGQQPLPDRLTPHALRRTFASLLFALDHKAPEVMEQLGHSDPKLTLRIYARAMRSGPADPHRLKALVGDHRRRRAPPITSRSPAPNTSWPPERRSPALAGHPDHGRGWFRTSDLSRVKRKRRKRKNGKKPRK
jgi:integrase